MEALRGTVPYPHFPSLLCACLMCACLLVFCVALGQMAWPSTALPLARYGCPDRTLSMTEQTTPPRGQGKTKTKWEGFREEAAATPSRIELDLVSTPERAGGASDERAGDPAIAAGGSAFLSDAKRLFRGMTAALRSGLNVALPW